MTLAPCGLPGPRLEMCEMRTRKQQTGSVSFENVTLLALVAALGSGLTTEHDTTTEGIRR